MRARHVAYESAVCVGASGGRGLASDLGPLGERANTPFSTLGITAEKERGVRVFHLQCYIPNSISFFSRFDFRGTGFGGMGARQVSLECANVLRSFLCATVDVWERMTLSVSIELFMALAALCKSKVSRMRTTNRPAWCFWRHLLRSVMSLVLFRQFVLLHLSCWRRATILFNSHTFASSDVCFRSAFVCDGNFT